MSKGIWRCFRNELNSIVRHTDLEFKYFETGNPLNEECWKLNSVDPHGAPFQVFCVHLKSRWSDERDPESTLRRAREARHTGTA